MPLGQRLRVNLRQHRLHCANDRPFAYRIAGFPFVCIPGFPDSEDVYLTGEADEPEFSLWRAWLEPGDAVVDVGANLGLYTACACHLLHGRGAILAVEASPELAKNLKTCATLLGWRGVEIEAVAASDEAADVALFAAPSGRGTGGQTLYRDRSRNSEYVPRTVPMATLAAMVGRHPAVTLPAAVKLDIEGAEVRALRGAPDGWFAPDGPLWIVEINPGALARAGESPAGIMERFRESAFACRLLPQYPHAGGRTLPARPVAARETFSEALFYNLLAVPRGDRFAARRRRLKHCLPDASLPL